MACLCDGDWSAELPLGRNWTVSVLAFVLMYLYIQSYSAKKLSGIWSLWSFSLFFLVCQRIWVIPWYVSIRAYCKVRVCMCMLIIYLLLTCYSYNITQYDKFIDFAFKYSIMYFNVFYLKPFLACYHPFFSFPCRFVLKGCTLVL